MQSILPQIVKKIKPVHVTAFLVSIVSGIVILAYKWVNPNKEAERHYIEHENYAAYRVMEGCYIVILAAAAYNFRYLVFDVVKEVFYSTAPVLSSEVVKSKRAVR
jgi:hypothetical protein